MKHLLKNRSLQTKSSIIYDTPNIIREVEVASGVHFITTPVDLYPRINWRTNPWTTVKKKDISLDFISLNCLQLALIDAQAQKFMKNLLPFINDSQLMILYGIAMKDPKIFLSLLAAKRGLKALQNNQYVGNEAKISSIILKEWTQGVIPFYKSLPKDFESKSTVEVSKFALELDADKLNKGILAAIPKYDPLGGYNVFPADEGIVMNMDNVGKEHFQTGKNKKETEKTQKVKNAEKKEKRQNGKMNGENKEKNKKQKKDANLAAGVIDMEDGNKLKIVKRGKKTLKKEKNVKKKVNKTTKKKKKQEIDESSDSDYNFSNW